MTPANQPTTTILGSTKKQVTAGLLAVGILLDLILLICKALPEGATVWSMASLWMQSGSLAPVVCLGIVAMVLGCAVLSGKAILSVIRYGDVASYPFVTPLILHLLLLMICVASGVLDSLGVMIMVLSIVVSAMGALYSFLIRALTKNRARGDGRLSEEELSRRRTLMALALCGTLCAVALFFIPVATYIYYDVQYDLIPMNVLSAGSDTWGCMILFALLTFSVPVVFHHLIVGFERFSSADSVFALQIRRVLTSACAICGGYFVMGVALGAYKNAKGGRYTVECYVPFLICVGLLIAYGFLTRQIYFEAPEKRGKAALRARVECFVYGLVITLLTFLSALGDILKVTISAPAGIDPISINGYKLLFTTHGVQGMSLLTFLLLAVVTVMTALFATSLVSLLSRSRLFFRITVTEIVCGAVFSLAIGLFGKYYEIVQRMNEAMVRGWLSGIVDLSNVEFAFTVQTNSFRYFLGVMAVMIIFLIRKPFTKGTLGESVISVDAPVRNKKQDAEEDDEQSIPAPFMPLGTFPGMDMVHPDFDPCPAFTELDRKSGRVLAQTSAAAKQFPYNEPSLPGLVHFIVDYARDSRLHLSYTHEDIAAFIAGLGASRLTILQGMSGTGKTSLPKIFSEAIMGACEIIEVESSWRDKNELLGYYNEFSKTFTPKKFTQALYRARLNPDRPTFIVLDEMNLSRIEYYFSDFLSLMENEEDKREIKLLGVSLYRMDGGNPVPYLGLKEGHTLKIPKNIWFIGTANRDESTFEISDKVYDRAHTMNFNRRAPKAIPHGEPMARRYLSLEQLNSLLEDAKRKIPFAIEDCAVIARVEELLAPYNISFGNRIANQIEAFVSIYCACFSLNEAVLHDAVETILLSKVVAKLEYKSVENKHKLAGEFEKLELKRCAAFIRRLNED